MLHRTVVSDNHEDDPARDNEEGKGGANREAHLRFARQPRRREPQHDKAYPRVEP